MPRTFAITADEKPTTLKSDGTGVVTISVSNSTARPIRGLVKLVPRGSTKREWLSLEGEAERSFSANGSDQVVVRLAAPPGTSQGRYAFRLDVVSVVNEDDFAEGPDVFFEVAAAPPPPNGKKSRLWLWVLLGVLLVAGICAAVFWPRHRLEAAFSQSVHQGLAPLKVSFTNLTVGDLRTVIWNFGDGSIATNHDAEHSYSSPGSYVVTLLVATEKEQSFATNAVRVMQRAQAAFDASPNSGPAPLTVTLANQSLGDDLTWSWDFGNGKTSSERNPPPQTYETPGNFTVRLTATGPDSSGGANVSTKGTVVRVAPRSQAAFSAKPTAGESPLTVSFTDESAGNPTSWQWQFGDRDSSAQKNPTHVYRAPGSYTVSLRVTGPGGEATATKSSFIVVRESIRTVPNVVNRSLNDARAAIQAAGLSVGSEQPMFPFGAFGNRVIGQTPPAGTRVKAGTKVNLKYIK